MDRFEQRCFYNRTHSNIVNQDIGARIKNQQSEFGRLVQNVFEHMGAVYEAPDEREPIYSFKSLAYNFYKKFYLNPKISLFGEEELVSINDFVKETMLDESNGHRNKFSFLIA